MRRFGKYIGLLSLVFVLAGCGAEEEIAAETLTSTKVEFSTEEAAPEVTPVPAELISYEELVGQFMDSNSQRASAVTTLGADANSLKMTVYWTNSAFEENRWTMTLTYDGSVFRYDDCAKDILTYEQDGDSVTELVTNEYAGGGGYFEYQDGKLAWTGAADENCTECVFEKFE